MIDAAVLIEQFMGGRVREDLDEDQMLLFAVLRAIEVIGEAAGRTSEESREANPDIPWTEIVGMRNRLIHGYFNVGTGIVWVTATVEIPGLLHKLRALMGKG